MLARLLEAHGGYLASVGVELGALAASAQMDRKLPRRIYAIFNDPSIEPGPPTELSELLGALDLLASDEGATELRRIDREGLLPRNRFGPTELALVAMLEQPELAALARAVTRPSMETKFAEYGAAPGTKLAPLDDAAQKALEAWLSKGLEVRDHTGFCFTQAFRKDGHIEIEVDHGTRPRTRDTVDPDSHALSQVTDVTARRAFARLVSATGRLSVRGLPAVRELIRTGLGAVLAGDPQAFGAKGLYDLTPFKNLDTALAADGRLLLVELRKITFVRDSGLHVDFTRRENMLAQPSDAEDVRHFAARCTPVAVKVYLHHEDYRTRPIRVELHANGSNNAVDYDRREARVVRIVEAYLRSRDVMLVPGIERVTEERAAAPTG
jgi:hypothetical protein